MTSKQEMILELFAGKVATLRKKKGLSLNQMAARCKLAGPKISLIEKGEVNVTLMTIIELAEGLGVHPKQLLDFEY